MARVCRPAVPAAASRRVPGYNLGELVTLEYGGLPVRPGQLHLLAGGCQASARFEKERAYLADTLVR
jgi:hypothetical protein